MTDRDPRVAALLDQLVPPLREERDWASLAAVEAPRSNRGGRRLALACILLALAVAAPLTALALGRGWWFLSAYTPKPAGTVETVTSGRWDGVPWNLTSFRTKTNALCYAITVDPTRPVPGHSAEACDPSGTQPLTFVRNTGLPEPVALRTPRKGAPAPHWPAFPDYVVGTVRGAAAEVDVSGPHVPLQRIATIAAPAGLPGGLRFFVARRPADDDVSALTALDKAGRTVATIAVASPYRHPSHRLARSGRKLPLTHAAIHELRLAHRSPDIYLLASRDGTNVYRLGTTGHCYGSGPAANMSWTPPERVLRIVGEIGCGAPLSATNPIRDDSLWGQTKGQKLMTLYKLAGVASDGVVAVDLVGADGTVIKRVPVVDSVYVAKPTPAGVVAVDPVNGGGVWLSACGFGKGSYLVAGCR